MVDLHVAFSLLHMCGSYCKLVHLTRATPPSLCAESLKSFDEDIRLCFTSCLAVDVPDSHWQQAQLSPGFGGLGFCSLALHSSAAFISSLASSELCSPDDIICYRQTLAITPRFPNRIQSQSRPLYLLPLCSKRLDDHTFQSLPSSSSPVNKAQILSISAPQAGSWIHI